ncbi:hypothetical protein [uncultured Thalassospira sp.]|uniref:helix-turn-helix transcriptional regulator n=1 Tax=uncultured Thalassospira sp. TaxID=404382 RepID=UPI00258B50B4|nr:hypothetical protein [uncultured Thalassospira sp.]
MALERGRYDPGLPLAFSIARLFSLSVEEIFNLTAVKPATRICEANLAIAAIELSAC